MSFSKHQQCRVCKRVFLSPQHLISHIDSVHSSRQLFTFSSPPVAAPTTFRHYPNPNRNPNPAFQARSSHFDYYRRGYIDEQGKFHKGLPPARAIAPARQYKVLLPKISEMPKLIDLFPATSSEGVRTLPLLCQLDQRRAEDTVTPNGGANSSSIDLSLRL